MAVESVTLEGIALECVACGAVLPVPVVVTIRDGRVYAMPDMSDVWAHHFTHGVEPSVTPDDERSWVIPHVDLREALVRAHGGDDPDMILAELSESSQREWDDGED